MPIPPRPYHLNPLGKLAESIELRRLKVLQIVRATGSIGANLSTVETGLAAAAFRPEKADEDLIWLEENGFVRKRASHVSPALFRYQITAEGITELQHRGLEA